MPTAQEIDTDARYSVAGYGGIAFYVTGPSIEQTEADWVLDHDADDCEHDDEQCYAWNPCEDIESTQFVDAIMVGDDRVHSVDVDYLTAIGEEDYCHSCGQVGCTADGREE